MRKIISLICILFFISSIAFTQTTYTFTGNGSWKNPVNWANNTIPPSTLDSGSKIIIDPAGNGTCILDTFQFVSEGASFSVQTDKKFILSDKLDINPVAKETGCIPTDVDSLQLVAVLDTNLLSPLNRKILPSSFTLSVPAAADLPGISNQGTTQGSCTAFATAYATRSYYLHKDHCTSYQKNGQVDLTKILSPAFTFNLGKSTWTCDKGMSIFTALSNMKNLGVCTWKNMPYDENDCSKLPDVPTYKNASIYTIDSFKKIIDISEYNIKRTLISGYLLMAGVNVDRGFMTYVNSVWKSPIGKKEGGHAIVICGYDDALHAYKIMNSWGTAWGINGYGWVDYDYFKKVIMMNGTIINDVGSFNLFVMETSPNFSVDFKISDTIITPGTPITFTDLTEPEPSTVEWSFYGGTPSTSLASEPTVTYATEGSYVVSLKTNTCSSGYSETKDSIIHVGNVFNDPRDGQQYSFKTIGTQTWMTQNLNYAAPGSICYNNLSNNCSVYGRLYDWATALTVAPPGWHLPSIAEWETLFIYLGGVPAGGSMKAPWLWNSPNVGATNSSGFTGLPNGHYEYLTSSFKDIGIYADWWSSDEDVTDNTYGMDVGLYHEDEYLFEEQFHKLDKLAIRCIKD